MKTKNTKPTISSYFQNVLDLAGPVPDNATPAEVSARIKRAEKAITAIVGKSRKKFVLTIDAPLPESETND